MTAQNLLNLAESGALGREDLHFSGYCIAAGIDACFEKRDVPVEVYAANRTGAETELGQGGEASNRLFSLLGELVFKGSDPEEFAQDYWFTTFEEMQTDLAELRGGATILLDIEDGKHSVGLKPVGEDPDKWQLVGIHQIIAVASLDGTVEVQGLAEPETITTEQVWEYLISHNSPERKKRTALVFPAEPA